MTSSLPSRVENKVIVTAARVRRSRALNYFNDLPLRTKLFIAFAILVALTLLVAGLSYLGSQQATENINRTDELRVPTALASARAQANLLRMQADVRGYLALGDEEFREAYQRDSLAFEADLAALEALKPELRDENQARLDELEETYNAWALLPEQLFDLRDDQLEREPAYNILATEGSRLAGTVLIDIQRMIESQALQQPTEENIALLTDMANYQGTFASILSGLRGYVTTRNRVYKQEYEFNLAANQFAWDQLNSKQALMTDNQRQIMAAIAENRAAFLELPDDQIFPALEGERWREDLYQFRTAALPLAERMQTLLDELTTIQQEGLRTDLNAGRQGLARANQQTLIFGLLAILLGIIMALAFGSNIAGPIRRLTAVAGQIGAGDLEVEAEVESRDEIGILATTFNTMTRQLRHTLQQVRKEKKRADDLLNVVIPIGVELSSEKDFNRLLEKMLVEAKSFCRANAGILYLKTDDDKLRYVIVRDDARQVALGGATGQNVPYTPLALPGNDNGVAIRAHHVAVEAAVTGRPINVASTRDMQGYDFAPPGGEDDHHADAVLVIPLKNSANNVVGVMELSDPCDPETGRIIPFDPNLQQMMESFSSLAVAALEAYGREQTLREEIQQLRIEIDVAKREKQVSEIVGTDFFADLQAKAREMRRRKTE
jgi:methyl-accepting chemotaxis protein